MEQRPLMWLWLAFFAMTIGCRAEIHPVTTGSFKALPSPGERVLVEGSELAVVIPHTALNEQQITQELATVACHALATVWGYRPANLTTESSVDFCHLQNYHS